MMGRWSIVPAAAGLALLSAAANAASEQVVYSFGNQPDGERVFAGLTSVNGTIYGTTFYGGQYNGRNGEYPGGGTIFSLTAKTGTENVLWSFGNGTDGVYPYAGLTPLNGMLYGTAWFGGGNGDHGAVYSFDPKTGQEKVLYGFTTRPDGQYPQGGLVAFNGKLYGTTMYGGLSGQFGDGTIFSVDPTTGEEKSLYSFRGEGDGQFPQAGLILVGGKLYGTTSIGGYGYGTVFAFDPATNAEKAIFSFRGGNEGEYPWSSLISVDGVFYGTTLYGGKYGSEYGGYGVAFSLDPKTGKEKTLWSFGKGNDGQYPLANLISMKGILYGTTYAGGKSGNGIAFSIDPKTGDKKVLWSFGNGTDGAAPYGAMISVKGTLYGTTWAGGQGGYGTVFSLTP
jgi:uncharacterized repeat protein (TIGR03803 family)